MLPWKAIHKNDRLEVPRNLIEKYFNFCQFKIFLIFFKLIKLY